MTEIENEVFEVARHWGVSPTAVKDLGCAEFADWQESMFIAREYQAIMNIDDSDLNDSSGKEFFTGPKR